MPCTSTATISKSNVTFAVDAAVPPPPRPPPWPPLRPAAKLSEPTRTSYFRMPCADQRFFVYLRRSTQGSEDGEERSTKNSKHSSKVAANVEDMLRVFLFSAKCGATSSLSVRSTDRDQTRVTEH